jgi:hypothetical protein
MMISEIRVGVAHTINLGNYENIKVEGAVVVQLSEGDDYAKAKEEAQVALRKLVEETYTSQRKVKK